MRQTDLRTVLLNEELVGHTIIVGLSLIDVVVRWEREHQRDSQTERENCDASSQRVTITPDLTDDLNTIYPSHLFLIVSKTYAGIRDGSSLIRSCIID